MYLHARGPDPADRWRRPLAAGETVVLGRGADNATVPWEPFLSRRHVELRFDGHLLHVRRLPEARNPIYHAGRAEDAFVIAENGSFVIGRTVFRLTANSSSSPRPQTPPTGEPLRTLAIEPGQLNRLGFDQAPHRLDVLSRLPEVISGAANDADLFVRLCDMLLAGIGVADAVALVTPEQVLHRQLRRHDGGPPFEPSRRLVREAVREQHKTVLHVWGDGDAAAADPAFTRHGRFNWAFCTPVHSEACPEWGIYVTGRTTADHGESLLAPWDRHELRYDVKFTELVAEIVGALRQVQVLRERQAVFRRFFSPAVMRELVRDDSGKALEPRETEVTVLFCDLRGFSGEIEQAESQGRLLEAQRRVSDALGVMSRNILGQRGVIADFLGDAALGFWGWPIDLPGRVEDACRAALGIRSAFEESASRAEAGSAAFRVGIGIASGRAVAGGIGPPEQAKITVFGSVVNLASRLQDMTKQLRAAVLLDERTAGAVRGHIPPQVARVRRLACVLPYGFQKPLMVSELLPPAGPRCVLRDEDIATYEKALELFQAGDWNAAYHLLYSLPAEDRGKDFLMQVILRCDYRPPPDWPGYVALDRK